MIDTAKFLCLEECHLRNQIYILSEVDLDEQTEKKKQTRAPTPNTEILSPTVKKIESVPSVKGKKVKTREQMIIFVYDTGFCQTEADDPQKAVLFFHPHWVSDQQRLALCGQLMGAAHFCTSMFSSPRVLTLQCGKFVLKKFGRYVLSVGSDQTLQEWILQERFNTLELLVQFYHNSFDTIFSKVESDQEILSKKLTEILEVYIPVLQFNVCSVGNIFIVRCPKRSSAAFLEGLQLLDACCAFKGVLGGVILHNSRVIATQLESDITKLLALTDKFHIRTYAEQVRTSFNLPVGVQVIKIYIKQNIYDLLCNAASLKLSSFNALQKKYYQKVSKKKKEANKIFTVQEEEDLSCVGLKAVDSASKDKETTRHKSRKSKPKLENTTLKERSKSFVAGLNIKVCSTPTVEKILIHEELVSICSSNVGNEGRVEQKQVQSPTFVPDIVRDAIKAKNRVKFSNNRLNRMSMDDLMIDFNHTSYPVPLRYYSSGHPVVCRDVESSKDEKRRKKRLYKTIADPMNPVFRHDGISISKSLYNNCLNDHYKNFVAANLTIDSREEFLKKKYSESEHFKDGGPGNNMDCNYSNKNLTKEITVEDSGKEGKSLENINQKAFRRSLSLPLKQLFSDTTEKTSHTSLLKNKVLLNRTPTTPLTTKLSLLAFEENTDARPLTTPNETNQFKNLVKNLPVRNTGDSKQKGETIPCSLFVCGYQNMTILLVLDQDVEKKPDLILSLWEISSVALKKVENLRNKTLANLSTNGGSSSYSFLSMDSQWGTVQRSGPWGDDELKIVGSLNSDLMKSPKMTEIIIRNEDSVVYGYSCGGSKIFYQQGGCSSAGLPTPADLMGVVTLKARRRLERDRDIVLL